MAQASHALLKALWAAPASENMWSAGDPSFMVEVHVHCESAEILHSLYNKRFTMFRKVGGTSHISHMDDKRTAWLFQYHHSLYVFALCRNHCSLLLESDLALRISLSSCKQYFPSWRHSRSMALSITLVNESATWAPDGTHRIWMPFWRCSLISLAWSNVRNSWQLGGAVRLMRSYSDLQSVVIIPLLDFGNWCKSCWTLSWGVFWSSSSVGGMAAKAGGNWSKVWSACFHGILVSINQPQ